MTSSNSRNLRSVAKHLKPENCVCKSNECAPAQETSIKKKNTRKRIRPRYESEAKSSNKHLQEPWKPTNWEQVYQNIQQMRAKRDAAVDLMGAEKCSDKTTPLKIQRFHTLIGLMLSSQTKDAVTHAAVTKLKKYGLTVNNISNTSQEVLEKLIYPVGFYKRKAGYILQTCQILRDNYDSDIPPTVKELCDLPGVGNKMAYLCMDIAWDQMEGIGVDTHVHRISNRLGWTGRTHTKNPEETRRALEDWLPKEQWREVNLLLVGFGQQICLPVRPKCSDCLNKQLCPYGLQNLSSTSKSPQKTSNFKANSKF